MQFDKAIAAFKIHRSILTGKDPIEVEETEKRIRECEMGKKLVAKPVRAFIDNFGNVINSKYPEYGAIISADESVMMFTSRRDNTTGGEKDIMSQMYYEDIYISRGTNGKWSPAINMGKPVNTENRHDATVAISPDGQKLFIYLDDFDHGSGNIYACELKGSVWSKPEKHPLS